MSERLAIAGVRDIASGDLETLAMLVPHRALFSRITSASRYNDAACLKEQPSLGYCAVSRVITRGPPAPKLCPNAFVLRPARDDALSPRAWRPQRGRASGVRCVPADGLDRWSECRGTCPIILSETVSECRVVAHRLRPINLPGKD
jgi:hypothetical protein